MGILSSCSDEDYQSPDDLSVNSSVVHKEVPDFVATLSPQQRENLEKQGKFFCLNSERIHGTILLQKMFQRDGVFSILHLRLKLELLEFGVHTQLSIGL